MNEIGAYRVVGKLGEGGMGSVYVCEHSLLGRRAAIKMLLPQLSANEDIVKRFFNEARAVTSIRDPGIVQIFDFGFHTDNSAFIVMELLDGEPMDRRLQRIGRFNVMEMLRLSRLICTSLASAHAAGIVHRDLKPENLFLVGDPAVTGGERPKILDFGIAKLSNVGGGEGAQLRTQTGMLLGTPVYMSPEQCRGAGEVDHRADIYSMGCVMFAMLAGRPPFWREGSGELIAAHMMEPPPRLGAMLANLHPGVDELVDRCLSKSARDRPQSMEDLAREIGQLEQAVLRTTTDTMSLPSSGGDWFGQASPVPLPPLPASARSLPLPSPQATPYARPVGLPAATPFVPISAPTTMTRANGQSIATPAPDVVSDEPPRGRRALVVGLSALIVLAATAAVIVVLMTKTKPLVTSSPAASVVPVSIAPLDAARPIDAAVSIDAPVVIDAPIAVDAPPPIDAPVPIDAPKKHVTPPVIKQPPPQHGVPHDTSDQNGIDRGD